MSRMPLMPKATAAMLGGPALFLFGNILFKNATSGRVPLSHLAGLLILALLIFAVPVMSPLVLSLSVTAALVVVAIWERVSLGPSYLHV